MAQAAPGDSVLTPHLDLAAPSIRREDVRAQSLVRLESTGDDFRQVESKQFVALETKQDLRCRICLDAPPRLIGHEDSVS